MLAAALTLAVPAAAAGSRARIETPTLALGTVARGSYAEGILRLRNDGTGVLRVNLAHASGRLVVQQMPVDVPPGGAARIRVAVLTAGLDGPFREELVLALNDPELPEAVVAVVGRVTDPIEIVPSRGLSLAVVRGHAAEASLEIVNHERAPLRLGAIQVEGEALQPRLDVLEPGRRFRVAVAVSGNGEAGRRRSTIAINTSSLAMPLLTIPVTTTLRERVRVTPAALNLGRIRLQDVAGAAGAVPLASFVVTRAGSGDFVASFTTNLPGLEIQARQGGRDRWHATVMASAGDLAPGPIRGHVFVETNDTDYPVLLVPVVGRFVAR